LRQRFIKGHSAQIANIGDNFMRYFLIAVAAFGVLDSSIEQSVAQSSAPSIVGVWKVTGFVRKELESGKTSLPYGEKPNGYRMHTPGGYVSYLFASADRKPPTGNITDSDRVQCYNTVTAAVGTYKIDGDKVLFHVDEATSPGFVGQNATYVFKIEGQTLTMATTIGKVEFLSTYERAE
jgi:hypothetical protein